MWVIEVTGAGGYDDHDDASRWRLRQAIEAIKAIEKDEEEDRKRSYVCQIEKC